MTTKLHNSFAAAILFAAALALGACGGDDNKDSTTSAATGTGTSTTDTGNGTTRERTTGTTEDRTTKTNTRKDDSGGGGNSGSGTSGGGNDGSSGGNSGSKSEELTPGNTFSTAKTVCGGFLPKALERDLKSGKKSADEIAKAYSKGYPTEQRKKAYAGCKAGLKNKD